ncbi:MAG: gliding motility-associated C-terminal domain-containing protein [Saprospiraceae bacterium]|nr:gliding motility-associated C-terminal domain-containing protein [Saprospiraceae bacterium]
MPFFYRLFALAGLLLLPILLRATHNRAGEIHIRQIGPLTIEATIITWTKASSVNADRDSLTINWGDGTFQSVVRSNGGGEGVVLPNDIKFNTYVAIHTYAGPSRYTISMTDPNRNGGIVNVNPPSSDNVPFHIATTYLFQDPQFGGNNTTPYLIQPPIDVACMGKPFKHNPNAYDPDGDSLSYQFIVPLQSPNTPVPNYSFPNQINPGPDNGLKLDTRNGDILWETPQAPGEYNLAFIIVSWRNGRPIDTTIRDMQILVEQCENNPPDVVSEDQYCVIAGEKLVFQVTATDPDSTDRVRLTALGGPFNTPVSPATFDAPATSVFPPVTGTFEWQTACEHISRQPYSVVFKAVDTVSRSVPQLADLKTVSIKVVGPPPLDVQATATQGVVTVSWEKPYFCENAADNYFYGFSVWRREGSNPFDPDSCTPGLAGQGYTELVFITSVVENGRYVFQDPNVERGRTYCYRVLAKFARTSFGGYRYNLVESLPSDEVCVQLPRDIPLITNVSVLQTDPVNGAVELRWTKPVAADLDTIRNPGPYRYQLLRADGLSGGNLQPVPGATFDAPAFWLANDTFFTDQTGLNTIGRPYHYKVAFFVGGNTTPLGNTPTASSVFLSVASTDRRNILTWTYQTPWKNNEFAVFRLDNSTGQFDSIGVSGTDSYEDGELVNGQEYCYYVRSKGTYSIDGVPDPLFNLSQRACGIPLDTIPPCVPNLAVGNLCSGKPGSEPDPPFENLLSWNNPNLDCPASADAVRYRIWYAFDPDETPQVIETIDDPTIVQWVHELPDGLAGCYAVSAIDSVGNESALSEVICVDNCPQYILPNAFTPNGDEQNDRFTPFPGWRFISRVDFQAFNRWGNLVFQTSDPSLQWDGRNMQGEQLSEGTYFYRCLVYESRVGGEVLRSEILSGYIELIRGQ